MKKRWLIAPLIIFFFFITIFLQEDKNNKYPNYPYIPLVMIVVIVLMPALFVMLSLRYQWDIVEKKYISKFLNVILPVFIVSERLAVKFTPLSIEDFSIKFIYIILMFYPVIFLIFWLNNNEKTKDIIIPKAETSESLIALLEKNKFQEAFNHINNLQNKLSEDTVQQFSKVQGRINALEEKNIEGTIKLDDYTLEENKIRASCIELIQQYKEELDAALSLYNA